MFSYKCYFQFSNYIIINTHKAKRKQEEWTRTKKRFEEIRQGVTSKQGKTHLTTNHMYQIMTHLCRFHLREVISLSGRFFYQDDDLGKNYRALCEWGSSK